MLALCHGTVASLSPFVSPVNPAPALHPGEAREHQRRPLFLRGKGDTDRPEHAHVSVRDIRTPRAHCATSLAPHVCDDFSHGDTIHQKPPVGGLLRVYVTLHHKRCEVKGFIHRLSTGYPQVIHRGCAQKKSRKAAKFSQGSQSKVMCHALSPMGALTTSGDA